MLREVGHFRTPIILTVLMFAIFSYLIWGAFRDGEQHMLQKEIHYAAEFSTIFLGSFRSLSPNGHWHKDDLKKGLTEILHGTSYDFFILTKENTPFLRIGRIPDHITIPSREGGQMSGDIFIFRRTFQLPEEKKDKTFLGWWTNRESPASELSGGPLSLIIGKKIRRNGSYVKAMKHPFIPFSIGFLLLFGSSTAWMLAIRTRLLSEQLKTERARSAHLEDLGLAAAGLAHETKNPLGIISGIAQQILRDPHLSDKNRQWVETIIDEVDTSASRLGNFMTFAQKRECVPVPVCLRELVEHISGILQPVFESAGVRLEMDCPSQVMMADEEMLRQIFVNLLLNSLEASSKGGVITVRLKRHGQFLSFSVEDQGQGIPPDLLPDIFKPYTTGRADGHGLGLAIVKRFSEDHGWTIDAESSPNRGTLVTISNIPVPAKERSQI